jgi:hypothetical protein
MMIEGHTLLYVPINLIPLDTTTVAAEKFSPGARRTVFDFFSSSCSPDTLLAGKNPVEPVENAAPPVFQAAHAFKLKNNSSHLNIMEPEAL